MAHDDPAVAASVPRTAPVELTSFVGREAELAELLALLPLSRLLTLTGAGGSGKTRLAKEMLTRLPHAPWSPGEVAWVELAGLADPIDLAAHLARALDVGEELKSPDPTSLATLVRERPILLVLDNCEHLVDACAAVADTLLRSCPGLRILATSREALGVAGERAWLVPPLSLPGPGVGHALAGLNGPAFDPETIERSEAVRLFVARAGEAAPDFRLTHANRQPVAEICRRLDGIPLAIELAAARVRHLPPEQIRERLDDAFRLLTSGGRTAVPRHRTLRAAIDWSHDLLPPPARVLLRRLSVFRGGFVLEAAEAVAGGDGLDPGEVLDVLAGLVDRSLVTVREHARMARYGLLETVRQYAATRLDEAGEAATVRRRHAAHFVTLARIAESRLRGRDRGWWLESLQPDVDNVRDALEWTREHEPAAHVQLVGALWWFWFSTHHWLEADRWTSEALRLPAAAEPGTDRARLLFAAGALASLQGRPEVALPLLHEAIELGDAHGDACLAAYARNYLGMAWAQNGDPRAYEACARAAEWFEAEGDDYGLRLARLLMGTVALGRGDREEALALNREGVAIARRFGHDRELAISLLNLSQVHLETGEFERAEMLLRESLTCLRCDPSCFFIALGLEYLGEVRGRLGHPLEAARLLGAGEALRESIGARRFAINARRLDAALPGFIEAAGEEAFEAARLEGRNRALQGVLEWASGPEAPAPGSSPPPPAPLTPAPDPEPASRTPVDLRVRALGPVEVEVEGHPLTPDVWAYAKPRELLLHLLGHRAGGTRDRLGHDLWPGASAAQVKNSFHVTLHHLRRALGRPDWVVYDGERYRVADGVTRELDWDTFEEEARGLLAAARKGEPIPEARLRATLAGYRGDFMSGEVAGAWTDEPRERLRRLHVDLRLLLGGLLDAGSRHGDAAEVYHSIVLREDLHEDAHRRLMRSWARSGDRGRALRHYQELVELLRSELDAEPEPETMAVYEELRAAQREPSPSG